MYLYETTPGYLARRGTFVSFRAADPNPKTAVFDVISQEDTERLGRILWYAPWRKYAFFPESDTLYESICLGEIRQFLDDLMAERKR